MKKEILTRVEEFTATLRKMDSCPRMSGLVACLDKALVDLPEEAGFLAAMLEVAITHVDTETIAINHTYDHMTWRKGVTDPTHHKKSLFDRSNDFMTLKCYVPGDKNYRAKGKHKLSALEVTEGMEETFSAMHEDNDKVSDLYLWSTMLVMRLLRDHGFTAVSDSARVDGARTRYCVTVWDGDVSVDITINFGMLARAFADAVAREHSAQVS